MRTLFNIYIHIYYFIHICAFFFIKFRLKFSLDRYTNTHTHTNKVNAIYRNFVATTPLFKAFISAGGRLIFEDFDAKYAFVHFKPW